jgi:5-(carboxyamino)imidazole ribonucleotide mutase
LPNFVIIFTFYTKKTTMVSIIMGSQSDLNIMREAAEILEQFDVKIEVTIVSAHRTPQRLFDFSQNAQARGVKVIIAGAGGAAHLPGMVASLTTLPVIGVPIKSSNSIDGWDSVLSILQMPAGVPVATVALNGAKNAGILAAQILAISDTSLTEKLQNYKNELAQKVLESAEHTTGNGWRK